MLSNEIVNAPQRSLYNASMCCELRTVSCKLRDVSKGLGVGACAVLRRVWSLFRFVVVIVAVRVPDISINHD